MYFGTISVKQWAWRTIHQCSDTLRVLIDACHGQACSEFSPAVVPPIHISLSTVPADLFVVRDTACKFVLCRMVNRLFRIIPQMKLEHLKQLHARRFPLHCVITKG